MSCTVRPSQYGVLIAETLGDMYWLGPMLSILYTSLCTFQQQRKQNRPYRNCFQVIVECICIPFYYKFIENFHIFYTTVCCN